MKYFVWFCVAMALLASSAWASATTERKAESRISVAVKPKREAPLSSGSSGYHGPSYKYLPPAPASISASASGYDSYSNHGGFGGSDSAGFGYDFGGGSAHVSAPKVETYIVQTEPAHGSYAGSVSSHSGGGGHFAAGHSHLGHGSAGSSGYRYSSGAPHFQSGGAALLGHSSFGGGGGGYKFHAKSRPHIQTIIIPASSLTHSSGSSFGSGHAVHSSGGGGGSVGYQYAPTFGSSLHSSGGGFGSGFGGGHGGNSAFGGHSSGGFGAAGGHSVSYSPQQGYGYSGHGSSSGAVLGLSSRAHGVQDGHMASGATLSFGSHGGHSGQGYSQSAPSIPSTSYGVPAGPAIGSYHGAGGTGSSYQSSSGYDTPSYAVGHKGLGHFGFSASKPHFIASDNSGYDEHSSRAPFKPSTLLGTTHEVSGPAFQYLPPTSPGYEYQSPSVLHGGSSTASGASSTSIDEPNSAYLPPVATPGASYLPPHHH